MKMEDFLAWIERIMHSGARPAPRDALGEDGPWTRLRISYQQFSCARCKDPIKDGETVWSRGIEIVHDACHEKSAASVVHCWRCGQGNRLKRGIFGARCGHCRAKLAQAVN